MGHSLVPIRITARVIRRFQNNIFRRAMINMAESLRVHSLIARAALHSRASAGCNFGQTAGPSLIKFGTREGGREGRGGEGRGGEGTVHTFHKPEPLWPRSLAGHPLRGWPATGHPLRGWPASYVIRSLLLLQVSCLFQASMVILPCLPVWC